MSIIYNIPLKNLSRYLINRANTNSVFKLMGPMYNNGKCSINHEAYILQGMCDTIRQRMKSLLRGNISNLEQLVMSLAKALFFH